MASHQIYKNLHTGTWSLRHKGKVIDHPLEVTAFNVRLHIGESSRLRAIAKGQRAVHAWAVCEKLGHSRVANMPTPRDTATGTLRYDWTRPNGYIDADTGEPVPALLSCVEFTKHGARYWV
jgi:hypothetical protein